MYYCSLSAVDVIMKSLGGRATHREQKADDSDGTGRPSLVEIGAALEACVCDSTGMGQTAVRDSGSDPTSL